MKNLPGLRGAYRLLNIQFLLTLFIMRIADIMFGPIGLLSAFLGGLVYIVPNAWFAQMLFHDIRASAARQHLRRIYRGEATKIAISIASIAAVFYFFKTIPWVFFLVFVAMHLTVWITPWVFTTRDCAK